MKSFFDKAGDEAKAKYAEYMRQPGNMKMRWLALVTTASKKI
jgi:hypothetical protein